MVSSHAYASRVESGASEQPVRADAHNAVTVPGPPAPVVVPAVEIDGLLSGRRMNPRAARAIADRYDRFVSANVASMQGDTEPNRHRLADPVAEGTSDVLRRELEGVVGHEVSQPEELRDLALGRGEPPSVAVSQREVEEFMQRNKAQTAALEFANPIQPFMRFDRDEVVFAGVGSSPSQPRLCDRKASPDAEPETTPARRRDELAPATIDSGFTRRKDKKFERERRAAAPEITEHLCHDLLVPPAGAALFFDVSHQELEQPQPFIVPLPTPPAPHVA